MEISLARANLSFVGKPRTRRELIYLGMVADVFEPDLVVQDCVLLELKTQRDGLAVASFRQTLSYLKCWGYSLGLLVNFASAQAVIQRVVFEDKSVQPEEDYDSVRDLITPEVRPILLQVREVLLDVHRVFGLGYCDKTYRSLMAIGLKHRGLSCQADIVVTPSFDDRKLPSSPITPLGVEQTILVEVEAVHEKITARAIRTLQTHLQVTGSVLGLVVNFGKHGFQIRGVRPLNTPPR